MNNRYLIVVEGPTDAQLIKQITDIPVVITKGSCVSRETTNFLKEAEKNNLILLLLDPDTPGKNIANRLENELKNYKKILVNKELCKTEKGVDIANCNREKLAVILEPYTSKYKHEVYINFQDIFELELSGPNSKERREIICAHYKLGKNLTTKKFIERLNILGIKSVDLKEILNEKI
ncbi:MAG: ribonuclease M5 [Bacilli bacterium]|jgi:ribonuclease M5